MNSVQREEDLFDAARKLPTVAARRDFLNTHCEGDAVLQARVESLLAAGADAEQFFKEGGSVLISQDVAAQFTRTLRAATVNTSPPGEEP